VTKRTLWVGLYWARAWNSADKSVMVVSVQAQCVCRKSGHAGQAKRAD